MMKTSPGKGCDVCLVVLLMCAALLGCNGGKTHGAGLYLPAAKGEVRAGRIENSASLLSGPHADGRVGDYKIYNTKAAFIVQSEDATEGFTRAGGSLLDATWVRNSEEGPDAMQELVPVASLVRYQDADTVEVVGGLDGGAKAILVRGKGRGLPLLDAELPSPTEPLPVHWSTMYILAPDEPRLRIVTTLTNTGTRRLALDVGHMITPNEYEELFVPGKGFGRTGLGVSPVDSFYALGEDVSFAFSAGPEKSFQAMFTFAVTEPLLLFQKGGKLSMGPGDDASFELQLIVTDGDASDLDKLVQDFSVVGAKDLRKVEARLEPATDLEGVHVYVYAGDVEDGKLVTRASAGNRAVTDLWLEDGDYRLVARGSGRHSSKPSELEVDGAKGYAVTVQVEPRATLKYHVLGPEGEPSPCRITLLQGKDAGLDAAKVMYWVSRDGEGVEPVPPGDYTAFVSRGYEFAAKKVSLTVEPGKENKLEVSLERAFETPGWIAADFHTHCFMSIDSGFQARDKVACQVADGLEFSVLTDHDVVFDLSPTIQDMGLEDMLAMPMGMEISPPYGHSNVLGLSPEPNLPQFFPVEWSQYDSNRKFKSYLYPPATWNAARERLHPKLVQVNHPRSFNAYFDFVSLDPKTGEAEKDYAFSNDFDLLEVFNGGDSVDQVRAETLPDLFGLLNLGWNIRISGNSDQHEMNRMAGNVRTYVYVGDDSEYTDDKVFESLRKGMAFVTSGPFVEFSIDGTGMGGTLVPSGEKVRALIDVKAAWFVPVDYVELYGNGELVYSKDFEDPGGAVRFHGEVELEPKQDTWYLVLTGSRDGTVRPLQGNGSLAISNPVFIDLKGDGFDPQSR